MDYDCMTVEQLAVIITALSAQEGKWNHKLAFTAENIHQRALGEMVNRASNGEPFAVRFIRESVVHKAKYGD